MVSDRRARGALVVLLLSLVSLIGCSLVREPAWPEPVAEGDLDRTFTRDQFAADLDACVATLERIHPALYSRTTREAVAAARERALLGIDSPWTRLRFAPRLSVFLATFEDGHTSAWFPREEFRRQVRGGGRFLPFDLSEEMGAFRAQPLYEPVHDLVAGDRILSLGGRPIDEVVAQLEAMTSGPQRWKREGATKSFRAMAWLSGIDPVIEVAWEKADGRRVDRWLQGVMWHEAQQVRGVDYEFRTLPGRVGYIDFRSMSDRDAFEGFLETTFERIRAERITGLIVDLRNNGGGDSQLGDDLLAYLNAKPYRMAARKEWRASDDYRAFLLTRLSPWIRWLPLTWVHPMGRRLFGAETGESVVFESELEEPEPDDDMPDRFHGPCVFLIGPRTFSSALMLADAVATYDLATVMGEETSECPTGYGEVMGFALPNSQLTVQVSSARFVRASGDEKDLGGVRPDIEVRQDAEDLRRGIDTALERARSYVSEHAKR